MHSLWALLFKWFAFSPNLFHLIPSSAYIKLRTWLDFNSILDFVCAVKMSWISPINASFSFWTLDLVIGLLRIYKASFKLFIYTCIWGWLNCYHQHYSFQIGQAPLALLLTNFRYLMLVEYVGLYECINDIGFLYKFSMVFFKTFLDKCFFNV